MILPAIRDVIVNDAGVVAQLATYEFTRGTKTAAVFTTAVIPMDSERPAIRIIEFSSIPWGVRDSRGAEIMVDVDVWGNKNTSQKALRDLAYDVWRLLDRSEPNTTGYTVVVMMCDSPVEITDEDEFPGYVIRCRVKVIED
jgi:hypothetical protein